MRARILDLDGSLVRQDRLLRQAQPTTLALQDWGPRVRMACRFQSFQRFEDRLAALAGSAWDMQPHLNFLGSGDFHHVSLALLRRLRQPCNLLVLDNHPDWMRGVPLLHCGTWLYHAAQLPTVRRIFHVGGDVDFDNAYRWLAPWSLLQSGKIVTAPSIRRFGGRRWARIDHQPLRRHASERAQRETVEEWLAPFRSELADMPLYLSLDKDVLTAEEAIVNWDSGHLTIEEVLDVLWAFLDAARQQSAGMDVVGDWSAVEVEGLLRRMLHWTEHPRQQVDPEEATRRNEVVNLALVEAIVHQRRASGDFVLSARQAG